MDNSVFEKLKQKKEVYILGIESSCDETSASVVVNGRNMLSNVINSQIDIHKKFGGVVPEIASRNHTMAISSVVKEALDVARVKIEDIDAIAVTYGAGLLGALLVGVSYAKALSFACNKPLIAVNHIRGHIASNYIAFKELTPPFLCLIVSGGHTAIIGVNDYNSYVPIGSTVDDAVGEAFDKIARVMDIPYPGGVNVDRLAKKGKNNVPLPDMAKGDLKKTYNFSYSGLKTATINYLHNLKQKGENYCIEDVCCSFQHSAVDVLVNKAIKASVEYNYNKIVLAGGVAANSYLREKMKDNATKAGKDIYFPPLELCTDNAAMIASCGYFNLLTDVGKADLTLNAVANLPL